MKMFSEYHFESWGMPKEIIATERKRASKIARPWRSLENELPW